VGCGAIVVISGFVVEGCGELAFAHLHESGSRALVVGIANVAEVVSRIVDPVVDDVIGALRCVPGDASDDVPPAPGDSADDQGPSRSVLRATADAGDRAIDVGPVPGDDVENPEHGIAAVEGRSRPANDFDAFDCVHRYDELWIEIGFTVNILAR